MFKKTWLLSKRENGLVTCQKEAKTHLNIRIFQQKLACGAKNDCFKNMQNFVTIARLHPYQAHYFWDNPRMLANIS